MKRALPHWCALSVIWLFFSLANADYITLFGQEILAKSDLVVKGIPSRKTRIRGGIAVRCKIESIYQGQAELGKSISLCYRDDVEIAKKERVFFLQAMDSASVFRVVGEFLLEEKDAEPKLQALEKLLDLERIPDHKIRKRAYLQYCLRELISPKTWTRRHAYREWRYLFANYRQIIDKEALQKLRGLYQKIPESKSRRQIKKDIVALQRSYPKRKIRHREERDWTEYVRQAKQDLLHSGQIDEKIESMQFLALLPCRESQEAFLAALRDKSAHIRAQAVFYIGLHKYRGAVPALIQILRHDPSLRVRKNAIVALAKLQADNAIPEIRKYLNLPYTRRAAQAALLRLTPAAN